VCELTLYAEYNDECCIAESCGAQASSHNNAKTHNIIKLGITIKMRHLAKCYVESQNATVQIVKYYPKESSTKKTI
jgi:hypothetical protein